MNIPTLNEILTGLVTHVIVLFALWLGPMAVALAYLRRCEFSSELRALWTMIIIIPLVGPITFFLINGGPSPNILKGKLSRMREEMLILVTHKTRSGNLFLPLLVCLILTACQTPSSNSGEPAKTTPPSIQIATQIIESQASPTSTPACTSLPEGVTLTVTPDSSALMPRAHIEMTGLQPGEYLTLVFYTEEAGQNSIRIEEFPARPVDANGHFESWDHLVPPAGTTKAHWQIQIVHAGGVACADITLP